MRHLALLFCCLIVASAHPQKLKLTAILVKDSSQSRIVNGEDAQDGQFPWAALLLINGNILCGSALISEDYVLTAGHCAVAGQSYSVHLGTVLINGDDNNRVIIDSSESTVHEGYNPDQTGLNNDIALIKLPQRAPLNNNIRPIALATEHIDGGVEVTAMGWGGISNGGPISNTLRHATLRTITNDECSRTFNIIDSMLCTKSPQPDPIHSTCGGDSGSPLVQDASSNPVHVAVTSFIAADGCEKDLPQGFMRTASFRDWIRDKSGV